MRSCPVLQMDLCFCECPALALGLELHHVGEDTVFLQQLCGRTLLGYCTILEHHDLVRAGDSAHPVGDNEDSLVLNKSGKCLLNGCFVLHVQTGSGFIQQNDRRILQEGAGNGNALPQCSRSYKTEYALLSVYRS